jgi:YbbR domain-containing protein
MEALIDLCKEIDLELTRRKLSKYMLLSRHQNARQNHDVNIANTLRKCDTVQVFGNDNNISNLDSGGN